jgi:DNA/RNA-binding domain of Phe-tRNA-synthetase-like protein
LELTLISVASHPLLDARAFVVATPDCLGEMSSRPELLELLSVDAAAPMQSSDEVRKLVRDLLRHGGFKPTGRSKPASEYLLKASREGMSSINVVVDACNAVSLHSGLPISVVDVDKTTGSLRIEIAAAGEAYVFNQSGQTIDIGGLICLCDEVGPCANAVKDSQRTKTGEATRKSLAIIWGTRELEGRAAEASAWYQQILSNHGGQTEWELK